MQGDTLAPFLFIIVLDYALRKVISGREQGLGFTLTPRRSKRHPAVVRTDLEYDYEAKCQENKGHHLQHLTGASTADNNWWHCAEGSRGLQVSGLMGQLNRAGPKGEEGTRMEGPERYELFMELQPPPSNQTRLLQCNGRVCSPLRQRMLVPEANPAEVFWLHQNAACST